MKLAHDIPWSGHLGIEKTKDRVLQNYYWPGVFKDVADYCRSCPECQKTVCRRRGETAKLGQMPILDEPFCRVGIDIIGKLNRSAQGNAYILTSVDYATRYPEAIPLPSIWGPRECVTDDGQLSIRKAPLPLGSGGAKKGGPPGLSDDRENR